MMVLPPIFSSGIVPQSQFTSEVLLGTVMAFAGDPEKAVLNCSPPVSISDLGWLVCDGARLQVHEYPDLFNVIGKMYDPTNDNETFQLPDFRGYFLRGLATDDSVDKGFNERKGYKKRDEPGTGIGSVQECMVQMHEHSYIDYPPGKTLPGKSGVIGTPKKNDTYTTNLYSDDTGKTVLSGTETRPVNIYINFIIKARYLIPLPSPVLQSNDGAFHLKRYF